MDKGLDSSSELRKFTSMHIYSNILLEEAQHYLHSNFINFCTFIPYFLCRLTLYLSLFSGSTLLLTTCCANCVSLHAHITARNII